MRDAVQSLACQGESLNTDDVQVYNLGISILESNLPSLLPNMCRCWLDEDCDVRDLAIQLFGDVISNLSRQSKVGTDGGVTSHLACLVPFVPFLCAYASSALNSLDRSIRKDGALLVGMMSSCTPCPSFSLLKGECTNPNDTGSDALKTEVGKHVYLFLPSLERLLSSMSFGSRTKAKSTSGGSKNDRKRKRDAKSANKPAEATTNSFKVLGSADATILSLTLLLNTHLKENINDDSLESNGPDANNRLAPSLRVSGECAFLQGGSAYANSMLFFRGIQQQDSSVNWSLKPIINIWELPSMPVDDSTGASTYDFIIPESSTHQPDGNTERAQTLSTLVETLRIKFVELTQVGRTSNNDQKGTMLPASDLDTLDALVKSLKLINLCGGFLRGVIDPTQLEGRSKSLKRQKKSTTMKSNADSQDIGTFAKSYQSSIIKTVSLILENFPICSLDGKSSTSRYNLTNAELCSLLAEFGRERLGSAGSSSNWVDSVFSYILPRLVPEEQHISSFGVGDGDDSAVIAVLLNVARKLLLPASAGKTDVTYLLKSDSKRHELLQAFGDIFFQHKLIQATTKTIEQLTEEGQGLWLKKFAFTSAGRAAAMLLISLMSWLDDGCKHLDERTQLFTLQMASVLPIYLLSWGHQYPVESGKVLSSMMSVARRLPSGRDELTVSNTNIASAIEKLCRGYRVSINIMFNQSKLPGLGQPQAKGVSKSSSIFERSIEPVQKLSIGLVSILGSPNEPLINALAKICSRAFMPHITNGSSTCTTISEYILEVMHNMRKTMQVSTYLTFLINASGIEKASLPEKASTNDLFLHDSSIQLLCRFLICSRDEDPAKVLSMIQPTLKKWISQPTGSSSNATKQMIRIRAALSVVAAFTWNEVYPQIGSHQQIVQSDSLKLDQTFDQLLLDAMLGIFELYAVTLDATEAKQSEDHRRRIIAQFLGPITIILCYRDGMLMKYLQKHSEMIVNMTNDEQNRDSNSLMTVEINIMTLLAILRSKEPATASSLIQRQSDLQALLVQLTKNIEKCVSKSHLKHLSETLSHEVNHTIKLAPSNNK